MKKRVISFLIMIVVALALIGCDKYYVKIEGRKRSSKARP